MSGSSSGIEERTFGDMVMDYGAAKKVLEKHDDRVVDKLWVVGREYMEKEARNIVRASGNRPVLMVYTADGTPLLMRFRETIKAGGVMEVREGARPTDWLVHRLFFLWRDADEQWVCKTLFDAPVVLENKKAWTSYACAQRFVPLLRDWKPEGICISLYVFDRGMRSAMARLMRRRHLLALAQIPDGRARLMARLQDWVLDSSCADHDVQNGMCKGVCFGFAEQKLLMKNIFKGIRSVRDCMDPLVACCEEWVKSVLDVYDDIPFSEADLFACWKLCGVGEKVARMVARINLRFEGGKLRCSARVIVDAGGDEITYIRSLVLLVYRIRTFSDSRFLGMGVSGQGMVAAWQVGLDNHIAFMRAHGYSGEWYAHCYDLLGPKERLLLCKAALVAQVTDHLHKLLLKDDRVVLHFGKLEGVVQEGLYTLNYLVPRRLYQRLSEWVPGVTAFELESEVLGGAYTAAGYIDRRLFSPWRSELFKFCQGDVDAKVDGLIASPTVVPTHQILKNAQQLGRLGLPRKQIVEALLLIPQLMGSIIRGEHMHGAGAAQHKAHKGYGPWQHSAKTGLRLMQPVVNAAGKASVTRSKDEVRLATLKRKRPEQASGAGAFMSAAMPLAQAKAAAASPQGKISVAQAVVRRHHSVFKKLSSADQLHYAAEAQKEAKNKRKEYNAQIEVLEERLAKRAQELEDADRAAPPFNVATTGWTQEDLTELNRLYHRSGEYQPWYVTESRRNEIVSPPIPGPQERQRMKDVDDGHQESNDVTECPQWIALVCNGRDYFRNTVLGFGELPCSHFFVLSWGSQNPYWGSFTTLTRAVGASSSGASSSSAAPGLLALEGAKFAWEVVYKSPLREDACLLLNAPAYCFPNTMFGTQAAAWTSSDAVSFDAFVDSLPARPTPLARKKYPTTDELLDDATLDSARPGGRRIVGKTKVGTPSLPAAIASAGVALHEEIDLDEVFEAVAEAKSLIETMQSDGADFVVEHRGGQSTKAKTGKAVDFFRGRPSTGVPTIWVNEHFEAGHRSVSFTINYGDEVSVGICQTWCNMFQAWYDLWVTSDSGSIDYPFLDPRDFAPRELLAFMDSLPATHAAVRKFDELAMKLPQN